MFRWIVIVSHEMEETKQDRGGEKPVNKGFLRWIVIVLEVRGNDSSDSSCGARGRERRRACGRLPLWGKPLALWSLVLNAVHARQTLHSRSAYFLRVPATPLATWGAWGGVVAVRGGEKRTSLVGMPLIVVIMLK